MATTTAQPPVPAERATLITRLGAAWQGLLAAGLALAAWGMSQATWAQRDGLRLVAVTLIGLGALSSVLAAGLMLRRDRRGRLIGLGLNYVLAVGCLLSLLGTLGVYVGLDEVANRFYQRAWLLIGVLAGFLIASSGDRFADAPRVQAAYHRAGRWVMIGSVVALALSMGALQGLVTLLLGLRQPVALALLAGASLFGAAFWLLWRPQTARAFGAGERDAVAISGYLFIAPNLLGFLLFFAGPLLFSLYLSFTNSDGFRAEFVGARNYATIFSLEVVTLESGSQRASEVLSPGFVELNRIGNLVIGARDRLFWIALWNTVVYCFWVTILSVVPALLIATILNSKIPGMTFFRAIYFIPSIAGVVGVAVIWKWLYNSNIGFLNYGINQVLGVINLLPGVEFGP
ncbi:MAG: sugar ABC transporter permease, partial [Chloroflexaceae bacterium]